MKESVIYNFPFVNRVEERIIMRRVLASANSSTVLWLYGNTGCGKSRLVKEIINDNSSICSIFINRNSTPDGIGYIQEIINQLENISQLKLYETISQYITYNKGTTLYLLKSIISCCGIYVPFLELLYDCTVYLIPHNNKKDSPEIVLDKYLSTINSTMKKELIIVLDDLQFLDDDTLLIIINLIQRNCYLKRIKFIIITDIDDITQGGIIKEKFKQKLDTTDIEIKGINDCDYYFEIFNKAFIIDKLDRKYIEFMYKSSQGNIEQLKNIIRNLSIVQTILFDNKSNKAYFKWDNNKDESIDIIQQNSIQLNKLDKVVLECLAHVGILITRDTLCTLSTFVVNKLFATIIPTCRFCPEDIIYDYWEKELLDYEPRENYLYFKSNLLKNIVLFSSNLDIKLISSIILEFLTTDDNKFLFDSVSYKYALCLHSYQAESIGWEKGNFALGCELYSKKQYSNAFTIFQRIIDKNSLLSANESLVIIKCCYEVGFYDIAINVAKSLNKKELSGISKFEYYYIIGKSYNMISEKQLAITALKKAISLVDEYSEEKISAISILHYVYYESGNEDLRDKAKEIYYEYVKHFEDEPAPPLPVAKLFRTCSDYYKGQKVCELLERAIGIAQNHNDEFEKLCCINNLGFECVRQNNLMLAREYFSTAIDGLTGVKPHEVSYAQNNLSILFMIEKKCFDAFKLLISARKVNQSLYASLVIRVNLSYCYVQLDNIPKALECIQSIQNDKNFQHTTDLTVLRKCYNAMAYVYYNAGDDTNSKIYSEKGLMYSYGSSSIFKINKIRQKYILNYYVSDINNEIYKEYLSNDEFDFWFLTYSHD